MTTTDLPTSRQLLLRRLRGDGWVPHATLVTWGEGHGLTPTRVGQGLSTLLLTGAIERRWRGEQPGAWTRAAEYRVARVRR